MESSDGSLVERCLGGERNAFCGLIERHQNAVYGLALRWTRNPEEAADLAQETFVRAYQKLHTFDCRLSFRNWILTVCANQAKNRQRRAASRDRAQQAHLELHPPAAQSCALQRLELEEALVQLPVKLRIPLVLRHVEGLSYAEISETLGIGISAAKMRVKRARDELVRRSGNLPHEEE